MADRSTEKLGLVPADTLAAPRFASMALKVKNVVKAQRLLKEAKPSNRYGPSIPESIEKTAFEHIHKLRIDMDEVITTVSFSEDGKRIAYGGLAKQSEQIGIGSINHTTLVPPSSSVKQLASEYRLNAELQGSVRSHLYSEGEGDTTNFFILNLEKKTEEIENEQHQWVEYSASLKDSITSVTFCGDGENQYALIGDFGGSVWLCNFQQDMEPRQLKKGKPVKGLSASTTDQKTFIAIGVEDNVDLYCCEDLAALFNHEKESTASAYSLASSDFMNNVVSIDCNQMLEVLEQDGKEEKKGAEPDCLKQVEEFNLKRLAAEEANARHRARTLAQSSARRPSYVGAAAQQDAGDAAPAAPGTAGGRPLQVAAVAFSGRRKFPGRREAAGETNSFKTHLFAIALHRDIFLWDLEKKELWGSFHLPQEERLESVALSADGQYLAYGGAHQVACVVFLDHLGKAEAAETDRPERQQNEVLARFSRKDKVWAVSLSSNGSVLGVGDNTGCLSVFDVKSGAELRRGRQEKAVRALALAPGGRGLAAGGFEGKLDFLKLAQGTHAFMGEHNAPVQASSFSGDGQRVAVGTRAGEISIYDLNLDYKWHLRCCNKEHKKPVWVVELSGQGTRLAAGGYESTVTIYDIADKEPGGDLLLQKRHVYTCPFFIWSLALNPNGKQIVIGDWAKNVKVYSLPPIGSNDEEFQAEPMCETKREDRVFGLDVQRDHDGNITHIAVGGRDNQAVVYKIEVDHEEHSSLEQIYERSFADRVYTVAIHPSQQLIAVGGFDKSVTLIDINAKTDILTDKCGGIVSMVRFSPDGALLCVASEDKKVRIFQEIETTNWQLFLLLPFDDEVWSVSFSFSNHLVVAHGQHVTIFGNGRHSYGIRDLPSFNIVNALLSNQEALEVCAKSFPTIANIHAESQDSYQNGITVLHAATLQQLPSAIEVLVSTDAVVGMTPGEHRINMDQWVQLKSKSVQHRRLEHQDTVTLLFSGKNDHDGEEAKHSDPVKTTVLQKNNKARQCLRIILKAVCEGRISNSPVSLKAVFDPENIEAFGNLAKVFPDVLLKFLSEIQPQEVEKQVLGEIETAHIDAETFCGSDLRAPSGLWEEKIDEFDNNEVTEVAVEASRIPFEGLASYFIEESSSGRHQDSFAHPLEIIIDAAEKLDNYDVLSDETIVALIVKFKWNLHRKKFRFDLAVFSAYLLLCCLFTYCIAFDDGYGGAHNSLAFCALPFVTAASIYFLGHELHQIAVELREVRHVAGGEPGGPLRRAKQLLRAFRMYLKDYWNWVDIITFPLQLVVDILFVIPVDNDYNLKTICAALSVWLLFAKILFYARGFEEFGPLVQMIHHILISIRSLGFVLLVVILAFGFAFMVLCTTTDDDDESFSSPLTSFYSVTLIMYGDYDSIKDSTTFIFLVRLMFELLMALVYIVLLNVLIALMTDVYKTVNDRAELESRAEKAKLIIEYEKNASVAARNFIERRIKDWSQKQDFWGNKFHPKWLHILKPSALDAGKERGEEQRRLDQQTQELKGEVRLLAARTQAEQEEIKGSLKDLKETMATISRQQQGILIATRGRAGSVGSTVQSPELLPGLRKHFSAAK